MLIVFEGPDGGGKTTLAKAVERKVSGMMVHCGPPVKGFELLNWAMVVDFARTHRPIVCDRLHWGDLVYAPYREGGQMAIGMDGIENLDRMIAKRGGIIVHVTAHPDVLRARDDGDGFIDLEDLSRIRETYRDLARHTPALVYTYDTSFGFDDFDVWVDEIVGAATDEWARAKALRSLADNA